VGCRAFQGTPRYVANRIPAGVAERVLAVRARLAENPWAQVGGEAIAWELSKLGGPAVLPTRTIEEILARAGCDWPAGAWTPEGVQGPALPGAHRSGSG
jgi:hypothetical protein